MKRRPKRKERPEVRYLLKGLGEQIYYKEEKRILRFWAGRTNWITDELHNHVVLEWLYVAENQRTPQKIKEWICRLFFYIHYPNPDLLNCICCLEALCSLIPVKINLVCWSLDLAEWMSLSYKSTWRACSCRATELPHERIISSPVIHNTYFCIFHSTVVEGKRKNIGGRGNELKSIKWCRK